MSPLRGWGGLHDASLCFSRLICKRYAIVMPLGTHCDIIASMTAYAWGLGKNGWPIQERGISFERVIFLIEKNGLLDTIRHPNQKKYSQQSIFIVEIDDYAYLVPFVESEEHIFLKTIIPSRKATQKYLGGK